MKYQKYDLGQLVGSEIVEVTLKGNSANVLLMDTFNFQKYQNGQQYKYYGGYITQSSYKIKVPCSGRWFIIIDLGGYSGSVSSSIKIL